MRKDIKKVICERERAGSRDYNPGQDYDRRHRSTRRCRNDEDEYPELEDLPKHESMTARFERDDKRSFTDRLGALRGLVHKSIGKNWDKVYSELCRLVSPTGTTTEQHVHQHLNQFICMQTRLTVDGTVEVLDLRDWEPAKGSSVEYYVHPKTRLVVKNKWYKKRRYSGANWREKQAAELHAVFRRTNDPMVQYHKVDGVWYYVKLAPCNWSMYLAKPLYEGEPMLHRWRRVEGGPKSIFNVPIHTPDGPIRLDERGLPTEYRVIKKLALNSKQLKQFGLANDKPAMDLTHNRRSRYG